MRVLLVEDEVHLSEALEYMLKKNNYIVDVSFDGESALDNALSGIYDAIILDVMIPKIDGFEVLETLRKNDIWTPVIMLTAMCEVDNRVKGLDLGADDYLPKPFETSELLSRLKAIIRRSGNVIISDEITYLNVTYNRSNLTINCAGKSFNLTGKESELFELLMINVENVISKDLIIEKLWGFDNDAIDNNVEVYISFLRKKISTFDTNLHIKTIRGIGYILGGK